MKKTFDAVNFQRNIRNELGKQYIKDPAAFLNELNEKYAKVKKSKAHPSIKIGNASKRKTKHR